MSLTYVPYNKLLRPITIPSDGNQIVVADGGGTATLSLSAGDYWPHQDRGSETAQSADYPGLYAALEDLLDGNGTLNGDYDFGTATISGGDHQVGLKMTSTSGFSLRFSNADFTMDPRIFGFLEGRTSDTSSTQELVGPRTPIGIWYAIEGANDERRDPQTVQFQSDPSERAYVNEWQAPTGRRLRFFSLEGAHIWSVRANDADEADRAGLAQGNIGNGFYDFWTEAKLLPDLLAVYGVDPPDLLVENENQLGNDVYDWEVVRLGEDVESRKWDNLVTTLEGAKGETYTLDLDLAIVDSHYSH